MNRKPTHHTHLHEDDFNAAVLAPDPAAIAAELTKAQREALHATYINVCAVLWREGHRTLLREFQERFAPFGLEASFLEETQP